MSHTPQLAHDDARDYYVDAFDKGALTETPSWLADARSKAITALEAKGFPTAKQERWRFSNVRDVIATPYPVPKQPTAEERIPTSALDCGTTIRVLIRNGFVSYDDTQLPDGLHISGLAEDIELTESNAQLFTSLASAYSDNIFTALNTGLFQEGIRIQVAANTEIVLPIELIIVHDATDQPIHNLPRILVVLEDGAKATVIEQHVSVGTHQGLTNAVCEAFVGAEADLDYYKLQLEETQIHHISTTEADIRGEGGRFSAHTLTFGGGFTRNDIKVRLSAERADATINGLYVINSAQHVDNHTWIEHVAPNCTSHELYKGILGGSAEAVFNGRIFVHQLAQKTDSEQSNQNLLLSRDSVIDTNPELEIYADDVRCTHGATIGQLEDEHLFYLRARGVSEMEARDILVYGFAAELFDAIRAEQLRASLEDKLFQTLPTLETVQL